MNNYEKNQKCRMCENSLMVTAINDGNFSIKVCKLANGGRWVSELKKCPINKWLQEEV